MTTVESFAGIERAFFSKLGDLGFAPRCVLDIGASNGSWSSMIAEVFPEARFEMFEPLAGRRPEYDAGLASVMASRSNLRLHPVALGSENGEAAFWSETAGVGSSLLVGNVPAEEKITVPVRRLDDAVRDAGIAPPEIIKVDVQGGEMQVLRGGRETFAAADVLHLETWLRRGYGQQTPLLHELIDALRPMGFVLVQFGDFWRHPDQELVSVDAFFAARRLIERLREQRRGFPWPGNWWEG